MCGFLDQALLHTWDHAFASCNLHQGVVIANGNACFFSQFICVVGRQQEAACETGAEDDFVAAGWPQLVGTCEALLKPYFRLTAPPDPMNVRRDDFVFELVLGVEASA